MGTSQLWKTWSIVRELQACPEGQKRVKQDLASGSDVIVIPTHVSGFPFLDNVLRSFNGYDRYPILVVINECTPGARQQVERICEQFPDLPITIGELGSNSFELGGLLVAMRSTTYQNLFLLPHSCEVVDPVIFEIAFEKYRGRSVAFFLEDVGADARHWNSHIGKYRRSVLEAVKFETYLPRNLYEAMSKSEYGFTVSYDAVEPDAAAIFANSLPAGHCVEKFGRKRLRISTPYLVKWKSHWTAGMLLRDLAKRDLPAFASATAKYGWRGLCKVGRLLRQNFSGFSSSLRAGWLWHPDYFRWRREARRFPSTIGAVPFTISKALRYRPSAAEFFKDSGGELLLRHDLGPQSLVLDVGAYIGDWTADIVSRYRSEVIAFEPLPIYYGTLVRRFEQTEQVRVCGYGLADESGPSSMGMAQMGSSEFRKKNLVRVVMRDVAAVFDEIGERDVDLMKVNIEGGEYKVLERMIHEDLLRKVRWLMVQFHEQWPSRRESGPWRQSLVERIELTHEPKFKYPFVWECWVRKSHISGS